MVKAEAILRLQAFEPALRAMGAEALFLFGSTARGDEGPASDIDVFLDIAPNATFTLLDIATAQRLLSEGLQTPVDLTTRDELSPSLHREILVDALRVF